MTQKPITVCQNRLRHNLTQLSRHQIIFQRLAGNDVLVAGVFMDSRLRGNDVLGLVVFVDSRRRGNDVWGDILFLYNLRHPRAGGDP